MYLAWQKPEKGGKSIWKGRDDEEVNVETFALQYYEEDGCKGYIRFRRLLQSLCPLNLLCLILGFIAKAGSSPLSSGCSSGTSSSRRSRAPSKLHSNPLRWTSLRTRSSIRGRTLSRRVSKRFAVTRRRRSSSEHLTRTRTSCAWACGGISSRRRICLA